ncbi:HEPN domain-containing protein [Exiguobacterium sp.]|uniref:ApeA N-terminal domain 1-containing protein n=1 Tax=Exiguobacterium sp. TaxID=44751 RepID=UPI0028B063BD|nr:HEPN domain-containing protein [Exiguobacterium sp.]
MERFDKENIGIWYLPSNPEDRLTGTLTIEDNNSCELKIAHGFNGLSGIGIGELPIIHGVLSNGSEVTLINSVKTSERWGFPGFPISIWKASFTVIGGHYDNIEDLIISEIRADYNGLNFWLNNRPFHIHPRQESNEVSMHYQMPEVTRIQLSNSNIEFTYKTETSGDQISNFTVKQKEFVKFSFDEGVVYNEALDTVNDFSNFLTLCIGETIDCRNFFAKDNEGNSITLLLPKRQEEINMIKDHEIIIKFSYIQDSFRECLEAWTTKKELLEPIIYYFVEAHEKAFHVPMSFLKVVQAIEAFSRRMRNNKIWTDEEFDELITRITSELEEEDKALVSGAISNEPRLRKRLQSIFSEVNNIFEISSNKRSSYINKIVTTRNYYTHFDERLRHNILDVEKMYYLTKYMKFVLRILLLRELGIDEDLIKNRMLQNSEFMHIKENLMPTQPVEITLDTPRDI